MTTGSAVALPDAGDPTVYGGKAAQLALATRAGLPVPRGVALPWSLVDAVAAGDPAAADALGAASGLGEFVAVRSSAVGEDSDEASFAGQHASLLNVPLDDLAAAVAGVRGSVHSAAALAYRDRVGMAGAPRAGVVVQEMVDADVAGVAFHPHPVTGADEIVVECAWGLGESVVGGLVVPDLVRLSAQGEVLERRSGVKDRVIVPAAEGGTTQRDVDPDRAAAWCLTPGQLASLCDLTSGCREVFGGSQDLEWAFAGETLWLLQRRTITSRRP